MGQDELGDGAGIAWQEFAVGPTGHAVVRGLNGLLGREALLPGGGGPADADQASDLRDLEPAVAVEQEMAEQAVGVVIGAAALAEGEGCLQQAALLWGQALFSDVRFAEPLRKRAGRDNHGDLPAIVAGRIVVRNSCKLVTAPK